MGFLGNMLNTYLKFLKNESKNKKNILFNFPEGISPQG